MKSNLIAFLVLTSAFTSHAFAHDAKFHKGPKIEGSVVAVKGDRVEVKTDKGNVVVLLTPDTKLEEDKAETTPMGEIKEGQAVVVHGHKLVSGEMAATDIIVHDASGHSH